MCDPFNKQQKLERVKKILGMIEAKKQCAWIMQDHAEYHEAVREQLIAEQLERRIECAASN